MIPGLSKGTGRFNLLQGLVYSVIGLSAALSSIIGGYIVKSFGYTVGFISLAAIGLAGLLFFKLWVPETRNIATADPVAPIAGLVPAI